MGLKTDISWFTPQAIDATGTAWRSRGYTEVSLNLFQSFKDKGQRVLWNATGTKWHVNYCLPYYYQFEVPQTVGYTPWEFTAIPPAWVDQFNSSTQLWTTSEWCKSVYEKYNLDIPINVLAHGISSEWEVQEREIGEKFYFLHVGGELPRKNGALVAKAFLELFDEDDDYQLILKTSDKITPWMAEYEKHPQITFLHGHIPKDALISLYKNSHCMVYPTTGEGFGMIPFRAIATGMPTICTNLTGCADFADLSMPLDAEFVDASEQELDNFNLVGTGAQVADPNYDHLLSLMKDVTTDYYRYKSKTMRGARVLHEYQTWDDIADEALGFLEIS